MNGANVLSQNARLLLDKIYRVESSIEVAVRLRKEAAQYGVREESRQYAVALEGHRREHEILAEQLQRELLPDFIEFNKDASHALLDKVSTAAKRAASFLEGRLPPIVKTPHCWGFASIPPHQYAIAKYRTEGLEYLDHLDLKTLVVDVAGNLDILCCEFKRSDYFTSLYGSVPDSYEDTISDLSLLSPDRLRFKNENKGYIVNGAMQDAMQSSLPPRRTNKEYIWANKEYVYTTYDYDYSLRMVLSEEFLTPSSLWVVAPATCIRLLENLTDAGILDKRIADWRYWEARRRESIPMIEQIKAKDDLVADKQSKDLLNKLEGREKPTLRERFSKLFK